MPTQTVVLAFLTSGNADIPLPEGVEVPIFQNQVYAPGHPNFNANMSVRPLVGQVTATNWEVELLIAPITVLNNGHGHGTLLVNIYSDNSYVYQQRATVLPGAYMPIYFGSQALGYIPNTPGAEPMPIAVTMLATGANMTAILDTRGPAEFFAGLPDPTRVAGFGIHLLPLD
jgi:hypothetical protein